VVKCIAQVHEAVGEGVDLAPDFHGRVSPALALQLVRALEPYNSFFLRGTSPAAPAWASRSNQGSYLCTSRFLGNAFIHGGIFRPYLEAGVIDVVQPDLSHAGEITECRKIATLAETYGALVAFHCPLGPIALAASIQVAPLPITF